MNIYVELTHEFNDQKLRAVLSSGQAVVLHRLAVMSKDGDWILRETDEALTHILSVLEKRKAHYRFGAPLDIRWMRGGWSSHFEFYSSNFRVRTDFVTRPPRLTPADIETVWLEQQGCPLPVIDIRRLAELKKTNREKDYAVIGELARMMDAPRDRIMLSRSARELLELSDKYPDLVKKLTHERAVLGSIAEGQDNLEKALDAERRQLMHTNEARLQRYIKSAEEWAELWPQVANEISNLPLKDAHSIVVSKAEKVLPFQPQENG